ncbi:C4-dicarboxylate transporter DcuC [Gallaecimonas mangrovi]|uniref:C4-dicarboxylate transporter DcuC n=1 Tax=Gallaecimonas mangrovi TaxID=2291597 RepID=UPI000E2008A6|nr:C4-dicarboxylate transporter DcuC [Gallaecimonas mangrovi]
MIALLSVPIVIGAGYLVIKKYHTSAVLFLTGLLMMALGELFGHSGFLPKGLASSGSQVIDLFLIIKYFSSTTLGNLGLIIMSVGGFSKYMNHIGASDAMVRVTTKPLSYIKNPYVILSLTYLLGQVLNIFIPSAVGLAMLLLVALYPVLVNVGCSPASAAAVIATTACLDLGPASGASNKAADVIGIDAATYFVQHQLAYAPVVMIVIALLHYVSQAYFDKRDSKLGNLKAVNVDKEDKKASPNWFAILPILPLALLLTFSKYAVASIHMDVITAMFLSLFISMICQYLYQRDGKAVAQSLSVYLQGMGAIFASVVSLIIAAQTFVAGLKAMGFIDLLLSTSQHLGFGYLAITIVLIAIIGVTAILSGSGNAAFFSFSSLAPGVAAQAGVSTAVIAMPMQLAAGLFRSFSPVSGVVIACAGVADISPMDLVKRTALPMIGGILTLIILCSLGV